MGCGSGTGRRDAPTRFVAAGAILGAKRRRLPQPGPRMCGLDASGTTRPRWRSGRTPSRRCGPARRASRCRTISPAHASILHAAAADRNIAFLDAPVAGVATAGGRGAAGLPWWAAPRRTLDMVRPLLLEMGREAHHAGGPAAGAAVKLMLKRPAFGTQVALMAELIGLSQRAGRRSGARRGDHRCPTPVGSIRRDGVGARHAGAVVRAGLSHRSGR